MTSQNTLSEINSCLLYGKELTKADREMVEYTIACIQLRSYNKAKNMMTEDVWGTPAGIVSIGYYNIIWREIVNLDWCRIDAKGADLVNHEYTSKANLMKDVAFSACNALLKKDDPLLVDLFSNFIQRQPSTYTPAALDLTYTYWQKRKQYGQEEGIHTDISNAIRASDGTIRLCYIMMYLSTIPKSFDFLFGEYTYSKTLVKVNGFGLSLDPIKWNKVKEQIMQELGPGGTSIDWVDFSL